MDQYGFNGIEIAPTKIWSNPTVENPDILVSYKNKLKKYGKNIVALQSLLYGTEGLNIFGNVLYPKLCNLFKVPCCPTTRKGRL